MAMTEAVSHKWERLSAVESSDRRRRAGSSVVGSYRLPATVTVMQLGELAWAEAACLGVDARVGSTGKTHW